MLYIYTLSFLGYYLYAKYLKQCVIPEILMNKESSDLIVQESILDYKSKL